MLSIAIIDANQGAMMRKAITSSAIAEQIDARETVEDVAADYDLSRSEIEQAVLYQRAA